MKKEGETEMIDPHIHIDSRSIEELRSMALCGIRAVVTQVYCPHVGMKLTPETLFDYYDRSIGYETIRTSAELIETYVGVGISMVAVPESWEKVIEKLPEYLKNERVVCIGEIGIEPNSLTCPDQDEQEHIFRVQLEIAKEHKIPVVIHTPQSDKPKWIDKYAKIIDEIGLDRNKVVIDHATPEVVELVWDTGCFAGITVQPMKNITPRDAAKIVGKGENLDRLMINSDSICAGASDSLSVPKAAIAMRKTGIEQLVIDMVTEDNPKEFYGIQ